MMEYVRRVYMRSDWACNQGSLNGTEWKRLVQYTRGPSCSSRDNPGAFPGSPIRKEWQLL